MSYQLDQEKGKRPVIEMPPLPEEPTVHAQSTPQKVVPQYETHSDITYEYTEPTVEQEELEATPEEIEEAPQIKQQAPESKNEKNIRALREKAERVDRAEFERDEYMRRLQAYENSHTKQQSHKLEEEPEYNLDATDIVEGKHLKKYDKTIRELQEELRSYKQQSNLNTTEARLKSQYPDFDKVVSKENIEMLRQDYPEIAETLNNSSTDIYLKGKSVYMLLKKLGISQEDSFVQDRERVQKNISKPRPLTSVSPQQGDSPLSKVNAFANGLTDDLKTQLRKEMEDARRRM